MKKEVHSTKFYPAHKYENQIKKFSVPRLIPEYNYLSWWGLVLEKFFRLKNVRIFFTEASFNAGYRELLENLKRKKFVQSYELLQSYNDYPKFFSCKVTFFVGSKRDGEDVTAHATSMVLPADGLDVCYSKAIGEALERRAARFNSEDSVMYPQVVNARPAFTYEMIPQFTSIQKNLYSHFVQSEDDLVVMPCVSVPNVTSGVTQNIPMQCVYYGKPLEKNEKLLNQGTTNGCGGGFNYTDAALSAIYELIERDHFLLWWYSGATPRKIVPTQATKLAEEIRVMQRRYNLEVYFLDTSYDLNIKSCVCIIIDPVLHIVGMGGKAGTSAYLFEQAYAEALMLITSTRMRLRAGVKGTDFFTPNDFTNKGIDQRERETQCCTQEGVEYLRKTLLSGPSVYIENLSEGFHAFQTKKAELAFVQSEFSRMSKRYGAGYNLFLYSFQSKLLRSCSYCVVRAFVPSFLKLHLNESMATPLSIRLKKFMEDHDLEYSYETINKVPHIFP